jgi:HSP90 family molecular chaperone
MLRGGARRLLHHAAHRTRVAPPPPHTPTALPLPLLRAASSIAPPSPAHPPLLRADGTRAPPPPTRRTFASDASASSAESPSASSASASANEERFAFRSETKRVLDIVTHSLYTQREIFLRELVSNACDALEKVRLDSLSRGENPGPLDVRITTGAAPGVLIIEDGGCGMTREELVANLGTIARSGTAEWAEAAAKANGDTAAGANASVNASTLIGRFGVGFYAAFMVAERAEVFTRAAGGPPLVWRSDGGGEFTIATCAESEAPARGTRVVLHLKADAAASGDYSTADGVERILRRHSAFVPHPVFVDGARANTLPAVWALRPSEVTEEQHAEFYRFLAANPAAEPPAFRLHFAADAPLSLAALLYFPGRNAELSLAGGLERMDPGVSLYCRKVLIQRDAPGLLPSYLRFLKGVVDCEDIPLNISRETLQDAAVVRRLRELLTTRALKHLGEVAKKQPAEFEAWSAQMGSFIKEGACVASLHREKLARACHAFGAGLRPGADACMCVDVCWVCRAVQ